MKNVMGLTKKFLVLTSVVLFSAATLISCDKNDDDDNNTTMYSISGNAGGNQVVPMASGNGSGTITGNYNQSTGVLTYTTTWTGLSSAPTSGGFYTGATGASGTMVGTTWNMGSNLGTSGSYSGTMTLTADQFSQLQSGNWYYSYGTASKPNGEIRGQITATPMR